MQVYRKSLMVQMLLFVAFLMMGANVLITYFLAVQYPWIIYVLLGVLIAIAVIGFLIYKKQDQSTVVITEKEVKTIKYLLYGYFVIYILNMILSTQATLNQTAIVVIISSVLMLIAVAGLYIQLKILRVK
ncbi:MAG: hypothetical protein IH571_02175 [Acholeplasmataceae bacterium]|nr:hypothetical protein [Acholeplasmataceae bacterium]